MKGSPRRDPEDESVGAQRVVARSFLFVYLPVILLLVFTSNSVWEAIRLNVNPKTRDSWPLRFTLLDMPTTAGLLGLTAGLLLARLQWARANRPSIGYAIDDENARFEPDSSEWRIWLFNGGPGVATVDEFRYIVRFVNQPASGPIALSELNQVMAARNLTDGVDYFIRWQGAGLPYPPVAKYSEGMKIGWFTVKALSELEELDIIIRVMDSLGDMHERTLLIVDRLPSVTKTAVEKYKKNKPS